MYTATERQKLLKLNPRTDTYPHIANNGLRVTKRSSQAVSLAWPENENDIVTYTESGHVSCMDMDTELDSLGNWFEVQMRYGDAATAPWTTIYKGYGQRCEIDGLTPDSLVFFRMKRNGEKRWGTEIIASTEPPPVTTDDLNRAVERNSEYIVTKILGNTQGPLLKKLLGAHDKNGMTPLMVACHNGNLQIVKMLLSCGAKVNDASTGVKRTPVMFACIQGKLNIVQALDMHGVDWRAKDKSGCNAMHHAINGGNVAIVRLVFAKLTPKYAFEMDHSGWPPLMRAVILSDNLDIVKFLVGKGADLNFVDKANSKSVLMAAILSRKEDFVKFLLEWGADPFYKNMNGKNCFQVAKELGYKEIAKMVRDKMKFLQATLSNKPSFEVSPDNSRAFPLKTAKKRKPSLAKNVVNDTVSTSATLGSQNTISNRNRELPTTRELSESKEDLLNLKNKYANRIQSLKEKHWRSPRTPKDINNHTILVQNEIDKILNFTPPIKPPKVESRLETKFLMRPGPSSAKDWSTEKLN